MTTGKFIQLRTLQDADATIAQQQEIIDHQRNALQLLLNAIWIHINAPDDNGEQLQDAYRLVTSGNDERILSIVTETKQELDAIIERQRVIIEKFNKATETWFGATPDEWQDDALKIWERELRDAYRAAQNTTAMTGTTEE